MKYITFNIILNKNMNTTIHNNKLFHISSNNIYYYVFFYIYYNLSLSINLLLIVFDISNIYSL